MTAAGESRCTCGLGFVQVNPPRCPHCLSQDAEIERLTDALKVAVEALEYTAMIRGSASAPVAKKALSTLKAMEGERK